jgi:hypothetical protein
MIFSKISSIEENKAVVDFRRRASGKRDVVYFEGDQMWQPKLRRSTQISISYFVSMEGLIVTPPAYCTWLSQLRQVPSILRTST